MNQKIRSITCPTKHIPRSCHPMVSNMKSHTYLTSQRSMDYIKAICLKSSMVNANNIKDGASLLKESKNGTL